MITALSEILGLSTLWTRVAATGGLVALVLGAWLTVAHHYRNQGESRVLQKIEQRTNENVAKAHAARQSVQDIPADKLDDRYRRD